MESKGSNLFDEESRKPLRIIIRYALLVFILLFLFYLALNTTAIVLEYQKTATQNPDNLRIAIERINKLSDEIAVISGYVWNLFVPFLQLTLLFFVIDWLLNRFGIDALSKKAKLDWNIQTVIALIVISAFAIAALAGLDGLSSLKDVALVVVGFYFGSQKNFTKIQTDKGKISTFEEHENSTPIVEEQEENQSNQESRDETSKENP
jgi:hypothetical protein